MSDKKLQKNEDVTKTSEKDQQPAEKQAKAKPKNFFDYFYYVVLGLVALALLILVFQVGGRVTDHLKVQNEISATKREINEKESELETLVAEGEAAIADLSSDTEGSDYEVLEDRISRLRDERDDLEEAIQRVQTEKLNAASKSYMEVSVDKIQDGLETLNLEDHLEYAISINSFGVKNRGVASYEDQLYYIISTYEALIFFRIQDETTIDHLYVIDPYDQEIILDESIEMRL